MEHCPGQTDTEYRTEFSMWSIAGSSLIVATDIRNMTDIMKEVWSYILDVKPIREYCITNLNLHVICVGTSKQGSDSRKPRLSRLVLKSDTIV